MNIRSEEGSQNAEQGKKKKKDRRYGTVVESINNNKKTNVCLLEVKES